MDGFLKSAGSLVFAWVLSSCSIADAQLELDRSAQAGSEYPESLPARRPEVRVALPEKAPLKGSANSTVLYHGLTAVELQKLAAHDIVLVIDKSGSMSRTDCVVPAFIQRPAAELTSAQVSRWKWCQLQIDDMATQTELALPSGFSVLLFDTGFKIFPHATVSSLAKIFAENTPVGGTNLTDALVCTFEDYFRRRKVLKGKTKPLVVGIITDGAPNNSWTAQCEIIDASFQMHYPYDITVVFFLIGGNPSAQKWIWLLSHNLVKLGAKFPLVQEVEFAQLQEIGLARALVSTLQ